MNRLDGTRELGLLLKCPIIYFGPVENRFPAPFQADAARLMFQKMKNDNDRLNFISSGALNEWLYERSLQYAEIAV